MNRKCSATSSGIGLDVALYVLLYVHEQLSDATTRPRAS